AQVSDQWLPARDQRLAGVTAITVRCSLNEASAFAQQHRSGREMLAGEPVGAQNQCVIKLKRGMARRWTAA
ncbi:hypothetical protein ACEV76_25110, partial [Vibrio parahaemolyticus]